MTDMIQYDMIYLTAIG